MTAARVGRVQNLLRDQGYSAFVSAPGADLTYLTGHRTHASERPKLLIVPAEGEPVLLVSAFESRALPQMPGVTIARYGETDSPYDVLQAASGDGWWNNVLISDDARADVTLRLESTYPSAMLSPASTVLRSLRMRKDAGEVASLREAAKRADAAFNELTETPFTGATEREIGLRFRRLLEEKGLEEPHCIVASGPNGASPHHEISDRSIQSGEFVVLDFMGLVDGYFADCTRTVAVGQPSSRQREGYEAVKRGNAAGKAAVRPGVAAQSVDAAARGVIEAAGFGDAFIHRTGHGIGLDGHEEPYIVSGNQLALGPGFTFTVEPGVYVAGEFGIRIEDVVVVTDDGCEVLNGTSRELRVIA